MPDKSILQKKLSEIALKNNKPKEYGFFGPESHLWHNHQFKVRALCYPLAVMIINANPHIFKAIKQYLPDPHDLIQHGLIRKEYSFNFIFGDVDSAIEYALKLQARHNKIKLNLNGKPTTALEPDLMLWVWASIYYSSLKINEIFFNKVPFDEATYSEYKFLAILSGVEEQSLPKTIKDFNIYWNHSLSNNINVDKQAKDYISAMFKTSISEFFFKKSSPWIVKLIFKPFDKFVRIFSIYTLPKQLADAFDLHLSPQQTSRLEKILRVAIYLHSKLPNRLIIKKRVRDKYKKLNDLKNKANINK
ncbi:MAG: oxygenase MpaB family protein [Legionellaceae bacterium]|nr:oxygenase MpaB family protein [Legionellaceae bacterium]